MDPQGEQEKEVKQEVVFHNGFLPTEKTHKIMLRVSPDGCVWIGSWLLMEEMERGNNLECQKYALILKNGV